MAYVYKKEPQFLGTSETDGINFLNIGMNPSAKIPNFSLPGQHGLGTWFTSLDTFSPQQYRSAIPIVTQMPKMFQHMENGEYIASALKKIYETYAFKWSNISKSTTLSTQTTPLKDGQNLEVVVNHSKNQLSPTMSIPELMGAPIWPLHHFWRNCIMDADTDIMMAVPLLTDEIRLPPVMSTYSMSMLFIQPSMTMRPEDMISATFFAGMFPKEIGEDEMFKGVNENKIIERNIQFSSVWVSNQFTGLYARETMKILKAHEARWDYSPVDTVIAENLRSSGIIDDVINRIKPDQLQIFDDIKNNAIGGENIFS